MNVPCHIMIDEDLLHVIESKRLEIIQKHGMRVSRTELLTQILERALFPAEIARRREVARFERRQRVYARQLNLMKRGREARAKKRPGPGSTA